MDTIPFAELGKYGLPGIVAVVALWFARQRMEMVDKISELRVSDGKAGLEIFQNVDRSITALTIAISARNQSADAQAHSLEMIAQATSLQANELQRLRDTLSELSARVQYLGDQINRQGKTA